MNDKIHAIVADRKLGRVCRQINASNRAAHFQLHALVVIVIERVFLRGKTDVSRLESKRIVRRRTYFKTLQSVQQLVCEFRFGTNGASVRHWLVSGHFAAVRALIGDRKLLTSSAMARLCRSFLI